jgi:peptidoglycan/LPS O-acetylase OafA/YrhL
MWPIAVRFLKRRAVIVIALAVILLSPILRAWAIASGFRADGVVYELSWFRFDGLALGALLAIWVRTRHFTPRNVRIIACVWLSVVALSSLIAIPYGVFQAKSAAASALRFPQAQALFTTAMAFALAYQGSAPVAFLRSGVAQLIAKLSYCLYLVHLPLGDLYYWILRQLAIDDVVTFGARSALIIRTAVIVGTSFAVAALSQRYLEAPFMRLRRKFV